MTNPESSPMESVESKEHIDSRIHLRFLRHGQKEKDPNKPNKELELTEEGSEQSKAAAELEDIEQAVAFGSPNKRAQETAALTMAGLQEGIKENGVSFDEIVEKVDGDRGYGSKVGVDSRLDFLYNPDSEFGKEVDEAFHGGYYMRFLIDKSDQRAEELGDTENATYSRNAKQVGEIVDKYVKASSRWDDLVNDEEKNYQPDLERIMGSHGGVTESFLAKVIELTEGPEERDKFVEAIDNQCFDFVEGFDMDIINNGEGEPEAKVAYKKEKDGEVIYEFEGEVSQDVLDQIIGKE